MATIDEGLIAGSTNEYVLGMIQLLLLLFTIGVICRCLMILLKGITEGRELEELIKILKNRILAAILAASASGVIEIIERAFK